MNATTDPTHRSSPTDVAGPRPDRQRKTALVSRVLHRGGLWLMLGGLVLAGLLTSRQFASADNLINILRSVTLLGIVSVGVAFITCGKHYVDLSIPAIMAAAGMAAVSAQGWGPAGMLAAALAVGLGIGAVNGAVVGYLRLNPIIWTLAVSFFLDGFLRWAYAGRQIYPDADTPGGAFFLNLSQAQVGLGGAVLPLPTVVMLAVALAGALLLGGTRFGRKVQLTGADFEVARLSGVRVGRTVMLTFVVSGVCTAIAGVLLTSMNRQATFETGLGYDFNAVTAVVLGGVALNGGRGSVVGVLGGVAVVGVLLNVLQLAGVGSFGQMVVKGLVFIGIVAGTSAFARKVGRE